MGTWHANLSNMSGASGANICEDMRKKELAVKHVPSHTNVDKFKAVLEYTRFDFYLLFHRGEEIDEMPYEFISGCDTTSDGDDDDDDDDYNTN